MYNSISLKTSKESAIFDLDYFSKNRFSFGFSKAAISCLCSKINCSINQETRYPIFSFFLTLICRRRSWMSESIYTHPSVLYSFRWLTFEIKSRKSALSCEALAGFFLFRDLLSAFFFKGAFGFVAVSSPLNSLARALISIYFIALLNYS